MSEQKPLPRFAARESESSGCNHVHEPENMGPMYCHQCVREILAEATRARPQAAPTEAASGPQFLGGPKDYTVEGKLAASYRDGYERGRAEGLAAVGELYHALYALECAVRHGHEHPDLGPSMDFAAKALNQYEESRAILAKLKGEQS
jgi:hypothetical protein